jgi:hypothetical protein
MRTFLNKQCRRLLVAGAGAWVLHGIACAQYQNKPNLLDEGGTNPGMVLNELRLPAPGVVGTFYLTDTWNTGNVHLGGNRVLKGFPLKYDLEHNLLEIKADSQVRVCPAGQLERFEWTDAVTGNRRVFLNGVPYTYPGGQRATGVLELLTDGGLQLLAQARTDVQPPTYTPAVDMGRREARVEVKEKLWVATQKALREWPARGDKNAVLFGAHAEKVMAFVKTNRLKFNRRDDAARIVAYYNSLAGG